jgi:hypothetical protein
VTEYATAWHPQTPQAARCSAIRNAIRTAVPRSRADDAVGLPQSCGVGMSKSALTRFALKLLADLTDPVGGDATDPASDERRAYL